MTTPQPDLDELAALIDKTINEGFWKPTTVADAILSAGYGKALAVDPDWSDLAEACLVYSSAYASDDEDGPLVEAAIGQILAALGLAALSQDPGAKETNDADH